MDSLQSDRPEISSLFGEEPVLSGAVQSTEKLQAFKFAHNRNGLEKNQCLSGDIAPINNAFTFPCVQVMMSRATGSLRGTAESA